MLEKIESVLLEASDLILRYQKEISSLDVQEKKGEGVLSEADLASEKILKEGVLKIFPTHDILSEEDFFFSKKNMEDINKENLWLIDPIDGTNNYLAGFHHYSISVAYMKNGEVEFGAVMKPSTQRIYYAHKAKGAFIKDPNQVPKKITGPDISKKENSLSLITCLSRLSKYPSKMDQFVKANKRCRSVRRLGSAALDLCLVAEGIFDGFWESELKPWDIAAGGLICQEAGLNVHNFNQRGFDVFSYGIIARREQDFDLFQSIIN